MKAVKKNRTARASWAGGQLVWSVYLVSTILFLLHKMEGRFPGSTPTLDLYPDWHREMPGLLVSHEPFDTWLNMGLTFCFQLGLVCVALWFLQWALDVQGQRSSAPVARAYVLLLSLFWIGFGLHETHHIKKLVAGHRYVPGSIFAVLFVLWIFLALLPVVLHQQLSSAQRPAAEQGFTMEQACQGVISPRWGGESDQGVGG